MTRNVLGAFCLGLAFPSAALATTCLELTSGAIAQIDADAALEACASELLEDELAEALKVPLRLGVARVMIAQSDFTSARYVLEELSASNNQDAAALLEGLDLIEADPVARELFLNALPGNGERAPEPAIAGPEPVTEPEPFTDKGQTEAATAPVSRLATDRVQQANQLFDEALGLLTARDGKRSIAGAIPLLEQAVELGSTDAMLELALWRGNSQYKWYDRKQAQRLLVQAYTEAEDRDEMFAVFKKLPRGIRAEVQRAIGVAPDGALGPASRAALEGLVN